MSTVEKVSATVKTVQAITKVIDYSGRLPNSMKEKIHDYIQIVDRKHQEEVDEKVMKKAMKKAMKEKAEREAKEKAEREAREAKEKAEREAREAKEKAERKKLSPLVDPIKEALSHITSRVVLENAESIIILLHAIEEDKDDYERCIKILNDRDDADASVDDIRYYTGEAIGEEKDKSILEQVLIYVEQHYKPLRKKPSVKESFDLKMIVDKLPPDVLSNIAGFVRSDATEAKKLVEKTLIDIWVKNEVDNPYSDEYYYDEEEDDSEEEDIEEEDDSEEDDEVRAIARAEREARAMYAKDNGYRPWKVIKEERIRDRIAFEDVIDEGNHDLIPELIDDIVLRRKKLSFVQVVNAMKTLNDKYNGIFSEFLEAWKD